MSIKYQTNLPEKYQLHISDGRSQSKRLLPALEKDYFNVADMHFHTLLAMVADYARVMKFYNLDNQAEGSWEHFFLVDETVIIATILATDLDKLMAGVEYSANTMPASNELIKVLRKMPAEPRHHQFQTAKSEWILEFCIDHQDLHPISSRHQSANHLHRAPSLMPAVLALHIVR